MLVSGPSAIRCSCPAASAAARSSALHALVPLSGCRSDPLADGATSGTGAVAVREARAAGGGVAVGPAQRSAPPGPIRVAGCNGRGPGSRSEGYSTTTAQQAPGPRCGSPYPPLSPNPLLTVAQAVVAVEGALVLRVSDHQGLRVAVHAAARKAGRGGGGRAGASSEWLRLGATARGLECSVPAAKTTAGTPLVLHTTSAKRAPPSRCRRRNTPDGDDTHARQGQSQQEGLRVVDARIAIDPHKAFHVIRRCRPCRFWPRQRAARHCAAARHPAPLDT